MSEMRRNPEAISAAIAAASTVAICSHVNPDGDTIGSALAMRLGLIALGKEVSVFCQDKVPDNLVLLPGFDRICRPEECADAFDLFLAVDVSDPERLGTGADIMARCTHTAQIDHHPTNPLYAGVNSVDGGAPAACVLIYEQLCHMDVPITREIAMEPASAEAAGQGHRASPL